MASVPGPPLTTPLGNREGEWSPEVRRPLRSCHHTTLGGGPVACRRSSVVHRPFLEQEGWAVYFPIANDPSTPSSEPRVAVRPPHCLPAEGGSRGASECNR